MTARRFRFDIRQAGRRIVIVLSILLAVNVAFYLTLTRPKVTEYRGLMEGSKPQLTKLEERTAEVEKREGFLQQLHQAQNDLARLRTEVLSTRRQRMVEVQAELESLCQRFRIDLDSVTYDSELLENEGVDKLMMVVPLEGNYTSLRNFLQAVESSDKFLLVERVALAEGKQGGVLLELNITLATYFIAPREAAGGRV